MKNSIAQLLLLILFTSSLMLFSPASFAERQQATGRAPVMSGDTEGAKAEALRRAVEQLLLNAGAQVSTEQIIRNGELQANQVALQSNGTVRELRILSSKRLGDRYEVVVEAEVFPAMQFCRGSQFKKSLEISSVLLRDKTQANVGALYNISTEIHRRLEAQLRQSRYFVVRENYRDPVRFADRHDEIDANILTQYGVKRRLQYAAVVEISSMAVNGQLKSGWYYRTAPMRDFSVNLALFDVFTGERIRFDSYHSSAPWEFDAQSKLDSGSSQLWESSYGATMEDVIRQISKELDSWAACEAIKGRIVRRDDGNANIDIGARHGLAVGSRLQVHYRANFVDQFGIHRQQSTASNAILRILSVSQDTAVATFENPTDASNVQVGDFVVLQ